jgi:hypothetical protein
MRHGYPARPSDLDGLGAFHTRRELPAVSSAETATPEALGDLSSFLSLCRFLDRFRVSVCSIAVCVACAGLLMYLQPCR